MVAPLASSSGLDKGASWTTTCAQYPKGQMTGPLTLSCSSSPEASATFRDELSAVQALDPCGCASSLRISQGICTRSSVAVHSRAAVRNFAPEPAAIRSQDSAGWVSHWRSRNDAVPASAAVASGGVAQRLGSRCLAAFCGGGVAAIAPSNPDFRVDFLHCPAFLLPWPTHPRQK